MDMELVRIAFMVGVVACLALFCAWLAFQELRA